MIKVAHKLATLDMKAKLVRVLNDDTGELSAPMTVKIDIENTITVDL